MKKLLLIAASTALLSSTAMADAENMFYLKANAGAGMFAKAKDKATGLKMKGKTAATFGAAVGYYVMDNVRTDLSLDFYANPELKKSGKDSDGDQANAKHKANLGALMINGYVDLFDVSVAKVFIGAGVGLAQLKEKVTVTYPEGTYAISTKKMNNVAYQVTLGLSAEVASGVNAELSYKYADFGKTKSKKWGAGGTEAAKTAFKAHNIIAGIRFNI